MNSTPLILLDIGGVCQYEQWCGIAFALVSLTIKNR